MRRWWYSGACSHGGHGGLGAHEGDGIGVT